MLANVKRNFDHSYVREFVLVLFSVENTRRKQLAWIGAILDMNGWRPSHLAKLAGVDHSTVSKFLKDPHNKARLNTETVQSIATVSGQPPYLTERLSAPRGFAEAEAEPFRPNSADPMTAAVEALIAGRNGIDPWRMKSRALELAGYMVDDILLVDVNASPRDGDVVCVQIYDRAGRAVTAFRIVEGPFVISASIDPHHRKPVVLDPERAAIRGVVIASLRPRAAILAE